MRLFQSSVIAFCIYCIGARVIEACNKGEKKFRIYKNELNWFSALINCSSQGLSLATIDNQQDQNRLANQFRQELPLNGLQALWLGAADLHEEGKFFWYSTGEPFDYKNFAKDEPNNMDQDGDRENCLSIFGGEDWKYRWNDTPCTWKLAFACEYFE